MQPHNFFSTDATPSHSSRKNLILNSKKSPGSTQEVSESENRPATRGTAHSEVQGDERGNARGNVRPMAGRHLLLTTSEPISTPQFRFQTNLPPPARRGSRSRLPLRRPRLLRFERLRVSVESIQPRPPRPCEVGRPKGRRRKNRRQSHNFFSTDAAGGTPTRRHALGRLPTPPPLPENLLSDCTENCPLRPLGAPRRFRNPKIGQQLGAQPTPRFRWRFRWCFSRSMRLPITYP